MPAHLKKIFFVLVFIYRPLIANFLTCEETPSIIRASLDKHYIYHTLTGFLKKRTAEQFVKSIDPSKIILLEKERDNIVKEAEKQIDRMTRNDCTFFDSIYDILVTRAITDEKYVKDLLGPQYKIDENVELILDPEKRKHAKTEEERKKTLQSLVHFQIMNFMLSESSIEKAKKHILKRYSLLIKRAKEHKKENLITDFTESFDRSLDPHSSYLSSDEVKEFNIQMNITLEGIGVAIQSEDGYVTVKEIIPGGSADLLNSAATKGEKPIQPKDKILSVASEGEPPVSMMDMDIKEAVKYIRGKAGTKVKLQILRQKSNGAKTFEITLTRKKIDIAEDAAKISYQERKKDGKSFTIAVLDLPSFYGGSTRDARQSVADVRRLLKEASSKKVDGLILDLSRNGGGLLDDAVTIGGFFIKSGTIVSTKTIDQIKVLKDLDPDSLYTNRLIVLISRLSASASEIVAGALQNYKRGLIVGGDHTFGKGTVQEVIPLPLDLGALKLTIGMFYKPDGESTQRQGVTSDISIPSLLTSEDIGEKYLEYALPPGKIKPSISETINDDKKNHWEPITKKLIDSLSQLSKKRVEKDPKFIEIIKENEESNKNKGLVKLIDLKKQSEGKKGKEKEDEDAASSADKRAKLRLETPQMQEAIHIMEDWITLKN